MNENSPEILTGGNQFRFQRLIVTGIENTDVLKNNPPRMAEEEICLFHMDFSSGDDYFRSLNQEVSDAVSNRIEMPIVRFADGEYAFYGLSLNCNGLYRQAESKRAIKKVMPEHIVALNRLSVRGKIAPLIFPGNITVAAKKWSPFFSRRRECSSLEFLDFLSQNGIRLHRDNYIPFYIIYAYLTSKPFAELANEKKICIVNSEFNEGACRNWFGKLSSRPSLSFVKIPESYVATRWSLIEKDILEQIPSETDLCLVGAGVGALLAAVSISRALSIPAIDAGHVLNMMNQCENKSNGPRLYTTWDQ